MNSRLKAIRGLLAIALVGGISPALVAVPVMVRDFEKDSTLPSIWVVNIPNENASVQFSTDHPHDGNRCLKLHYHFVSAGNYQYLGIEHKVQLPKPIRRLRFWINGDDSKCSCGVRVSDASGKTHQYSKNTGQGGIVDFSGWREMVIDLDSGHETWGGDKTSKIEYPITAITFCVSQAQDHDKLVPVESNISFDSLSVEPSRTVGESAEGAISVISPEYCSDINGNTSITVSAPGFNGVSVKCWKQSPGHGSDSTVATVSLDTNARGSFTFPGDAYPHGPITIRISGDNDDFKDTCYLQLYNKGGISWNEGIPNAPPPAAEGMSLVFADDFNGPLSISSSDPTATYYDHKPPDGSQDFSAHTFAGYESDRNPFSRVDTYLRIRASDKPHSSGLISSMKNNATGITAKAPCYFECRFIGPNVIGTWPAFWLLTDYMADHLKGVKSPCDELDIIEAYGGEGPHEPNAGDTYMITPHCWDQGDSGRAIENHAFAGMHNPIHVRKFGIPSTWFETFHTYGCKITESDTIYYCDDIEVGRHATLPLSKKEPFFFLINLATGGGWPVDLSRCHGLADMYVDFVRVYAKAP